MRGLFSKINVPTMIAVFAFIAVDRQFDVTGRVLETLGTSPRR